ncbi:MAG TPA: penicillin-binding protein 2 [Spirochaetota bacterium]|nr:penicillin-binding protein 2 [Spirochaetota bacterium]HPJ33959.1 penicillin-binding protein 2 [Spirochaetota bacterium]
MNQTSLKARMLEAFRKRMYVFWISVSTVFAILVLQLINLQILQGEEYTLKATMNMENNIPIPASRGEIYDRNFKKGISGTVLVSNRPSFNLTMIPSNFESREQMAEVLDRLAPVIGINSSEVFSDIKKSNPWERFLLKDDVSFDVIVKIASHRNLFPNINWEDAPVRVYNYSDVMAHTIGYIGSLSKEEYNSLKGQGYKYYQTIGKTGIEKQYDLLLRGEDGYIRRIVDVKNRTEGEEIGKMPTAGNNVVLTIDYDVQEAAHNALEGHTGAVVVIKASTGEIISMVSRPGFDPNAIISKENAGIIRDLNRDPAKPFLNRTIQSRYPPASTFKIITSIAALETEKTYPDKTYYCSGKYTLKGYVDTDFYCFRTHGKLDLYWALGKSCSVYFYQLGMVVGPTMIMKYAHYMGLDEMTRVDIPGEISGFIPSQRWKLKTFGQPWFDGDTINLSIGQGFLSVTPIGLANMMCGIVNNGIVYKPHLVKEVYSPDNRVVLQTTGKEKLREVPLSPITLNTIKQGMRYGSQGGTSRWLGRHKVPIAGKTGTAQTRSNRKENYSQHAWFLGFAPYDKLTENPIVVCVFIEYGQWGAAAAVPVADKIFTKLIELGYFRDMDQKTDVRQIK